MDPLILFSILLSVILGVLRGADLASVSYTHLTLPTNDSV